MPQYGRRPFSEATINVVSISSSGLPGRFPHVGEREAHGYLCKAATKVERPGDLIRLGEEVFECGWPDISVTFRYPGASGSEIRELTLVRPPRHGGPDQTAVAEG